MVQTTSSEEFQELGRSFYKRKEYAKAVAAFTNGINVAVFPTVTLYDYRAASHEKLADFDAAIRDGRAAIRLDKKDVRGYLRTASVLQKLDKPETALDIYKYGMKHVPVNDKDFKLLQQLHNKLTRKLAPATAIDPFSVLPVELVELIISDLSFRHMVNCLRVSKSWLEYLTSRPGLWTNLDLSEASKPVSRAFIGKAVRHSHNSVNRLIVHRFQHTDILRNIATVCKGLAELHVLSLPVMLGKTLIEVAQCAFNLKRLEVKTEISFDTVTQILRHRPTLEHVEFAAIAEAGSPSPWKGPFPRLQTCVLGCIPGRMPTVPLADFLEQAPELRYLTLSRWALPHGLLNDHDDALGNSKLLSLRLENMSIDAFPWLPQTIESFSMQHPSRFVCPQSAADVHAGPWAALSLINVHRSCLPNVKHLCLKDVQGLQSQFIEALLDLKQEGTSPVQPMNQDCSRLESLVLSGVLDPGHLGRDLAVIRLLESPRILTPALRHLALQLLPCTDELVDHLLAQGVPHIQTLDLSTTRVTGASVKMLADNLPELRYLNVDNCPNINGRDAIDYAQRKGITVSNKRNDLYARKGARKTRYGE